MRKIEIYRYTPAIKREWDEMVRNSRNSTFLFMRDYMDYHSDRFKDHSLIARSRGRIVAMLPADEAVDDDGKKILRSHGGLTYGGWILPPRHADAPDILQIFDLLTGYAKENGIAKLDYKPLPHIYCNMPSDEDRYALFRFGARLKECDLSCAIDLRNNPGFNTRQKRNLKKGSGAEIEFAESENCTEFHQLLTNCLEERHGVKPVHSCAELDMLRERFPENIRIFTVKSIQGRVEAGVCMFDTGVVAHAQYICSSEFGRNEGMLTKLFDWLIHEKFSGRRYFDFGTSNESRGMYLNEGLYQQKAGLGGSGVAYERYELDFK